MTVVRRPILVLAPLAVLVIVGALATNVLPLREIIAQRQVIVESQERLDSLVAENDELERHAAALDSSIEVERLARSELGYIRPGEQAFVMISQEAEETSPAVSEEGRSAMMAGGADTSAAGHPGGGMLARIWDFMTGRDLSG